MTGPRAHPRHDLQPALESPVRLSIVAALSGVDKADFATIRATVEITDSALSKQLAILETAELVELSKERVGRKARTWLRLTETGRTAFAGHLDALRRIAELRPGATTE